MGINFETLKAGFREYLEAKYTKENDQEKLDELLCADKSIFMMSDEFQDYVKSEYNISSFDAANLLDILNEQYEQEEEALEKAERQEGDEVSKNEQPQDKTQAEMFDENENVTKGRNGKYYLRTNKAGVSDIGGIVSNVYGVELDSDEGKAISEQIMAQNPSLFKDGLDSTLKSARVQLIDATNILGLRVPETISMEGMEKYSKESGVQFEDPEFIQEILNELLADADFKSALGLEEDGEMTDEQLATFFNAINSYDSNTNEISVKDVLSAVEDIGDGVFRMKTEEEIKELEQTPPEEIESQPAASAPASGQQGVSAVSGSYTASGASGVSIQRQTHDANGNPILENMTLDELQAELESANADVTAKQAELTNAQTAKEESLKEESELKQEEQEAYQNFANELKQKDKERLDAAVKGVDDAQEALDNNTNAISEKEKVISQYDGQIAQFDASLTAYTAQLSSLEAAKSSLQSKDDADSSKLAEIESKIQSLKQRINEINTQQRALRVKSGLEQRRLDVLTGQTDNLKEALSKAQDNLSAVEDDICGSDEKLQELREEYDAKRQAVEQKRQECDKAIQTAQDNLKTAQEKVQKIEAAISQAKAVNDIKENYATQDGSELIELAAQFEGMSESEVEAICGYNLPDGLWCAAFVKYIATETYGQENLPSWYTNCNYNSCSEVLNAAQQNGAAFTDASQAQPGDMIIFNTSRGQARHIGYVVSVENGVVTTIEGNTSSKVGYRTYNVGDTSRINSYVRLGV